MFVGLNPSAADATVDDPTSRRCIAFAQAWGYDALCMTNLFAWRATRPADMKVQADPVGPLNDMTLQETARNASVIVAAWGVHGSHRGRDGEVRQMVPGLACLRLTMDGAPAHPLYLPASLKPTPWRLPEGR